MTACWPGTMRRDKTIIGKLILTFALVFCALSSIGQIVVDFSVPLNTCSSQSFFPQNQSVNATSFDWDFCENDLTQTPVFSEVIQTSAATVLDLKIQQEGDKWFAFAVDADGNTLLRFDFGNSLANTPTITTAATINTPTGVELVEIDGQWFGFIATFNLPSRLYVLSFGNSLSNSPVLTQITLPNNSIISARSVNIVKQGLNHILFIANWSQNKITRVDLGATPFSATPVSVDLIDLGAATQLSGMDVVSDGTNRYLFVTSYASHQLLKLSFGADWNNPAPTVSQITGLMITNPTMVEIEYEAGNYFAMLAQNSGQIFRIELGNDLSTNNPNSIADLGVFGTLSNLRGMDIVRNNGSFIALASSFISNKLYRLEFKSASCQASILASSDENPPRLNFASAGSYPITLRGRSNAFDEKRMTRTVTVSPLVAPDIAFSFSGECRGEAISFTPQNSSGDIISSSWDFGDGGNTNDFQTSHTYSSAGSFTPRITVTSSNGCTNFTTQPIQVFSVTANFTMPAPSQICTQQEYVFANTSLNDGGPVSFEWKVNGELESTEEDLHTLFTDVDQKQITLTARNHSCIDTKEETIATLLPGPMVDFITDGNCEDRIVSFHENVTDEVTTFSWDFGDGEASSSPNPDHTFINIGLFDVSLMVVSSNGCNNSVRKLVEINQTPVPDFSIEGPPSSCSNYASQFSDLTPAISGGAIATWQWSFDDGANSTDQNPSHTYLQPGDYNVSLTVTTDQGCSNGVVIPVTILQSPSLSFDNSAACVNNAVSFIGTSNTAIHYYWEIGTSYYETQNANHVFSSPGTYAAKLSAVGSNGCVTSLTRNVFVPTPVNPVFTAVNNCKGYEARFTSTAAGADPVVKRSWNFANEGTSAEINPAFTFTSLGSKLVTLQVTTAAGCIYQRQGSVNIIEPPVANFTFTPDFGVPPQEISFINSSANANSFNWNFGDGAVSTTTSPTHTFNELGDFNVELTATNNAACQTSLTKVVSMVAPLPDVDLSLMTITPNGDGTSKVIITIANNGNTFLKNLPVRLDVSGNVTLETVVQEPIAPFSKYNLVLNFGIAQNQALEFLCASTTLEGDLNPEGNRICNPLKTDVAILLPYPNPAKNVLTVEWVAQEGEEVKVDLVNTDGKSAIHFTEISSAGLNQKMLDIARLRSGIYILRIVTPTHSKTHRILVSN